MKKSLSLLVAIALVFSMFSSMAFAADAALTTEQKYEALVKAGIFEGSDDGQAHLDKTMTRAQAAKIVSLLAGYKAGVVVKDAGYTDLSGAGWAKDYINFASEIGVLEGKGNKKFDPSANVTIQQLATIVVKLVKTAGVVLPAGEAVEGDVAEWAAADVAAVVKAGLIAKQADYTVGALRALLVNVAYDAQAALASAGELNVVAKATGAKKITVSFNKAVDKAKAKIVVKNNNHEVSIKDAVWAEDTKSVVLEFATNLAAAEYVVTVSELSEKALTSTVKVEEEKIAEIKFQSDKAPVTRLAAGTPQNYKQITVGYVVTNQYGENISATTALNATATKGSAVASNGVVTIDETSTNGFYNINEQVHVTLLHVGGTYINATLTVASEARVSSVSISGLQHDDEKELTVGATSSEFSLVLDLKDQYGNSVKNAAFAAGDTIASSTNPIVSTLGTITTKNIKGVNQLVLPLSGTLQAGTTTVSLMSISTGNRATLDVVVKDAKKLDKLTLSQPASAPAGGTVEIPFTALDQFGAVIDHPTDAQLLSRTISGGTGLASDISFVKDVVKNKTALKVKLPVQKGSAVLVLVTQTNEVVRLTLNVTDVVAPASIGGLKDVATSQLKDDSVTIAKGNVIVKDQYGNDIDLSTRYATSETVATAGQFRVVATASNANISTVGGAVYNATPVTLKGDAKGNTTITLKLQVASVDATGVKWADVTNSSYNYTQRVVEKADIKSYEATVAGKIYTTVGGATPAGYEKALELKGILADDSKVAIPATADNYEVQINQNGFVYAGGKLAVTAQTPAGVDFATDKSEKEISVLVLVKGATTEILTVTAVVSKVAPEVTKLALKDSAGAITKENDNTISIAKTSLITFNPTSLAQLAVKAEDQYGQAIANSINGAITSKTFADAEVGKTISVAATTTNNSKIIINVVVK